MQRRSSVMSGPLEIPADNGSRASGSDYGSRNHTPKTGRGLVSGSYFLAASSRRMTFAADNGAIASGDGSIGTFGITAAPMEFLAAGTEQQVLARRGESGMFKPEEPKPIFMTDPFPVEELLSKKLQPAETPAEHLVHDGSLAIIYVRGGSEHRALLYLLTKVNRHFGLDDLLPDVPEDIAAYHYELQRMPGVEYVDGDAVTFFDSSVLPAGLVLRKVKVAVRNALNSTRLDSTLVRRKQPTAALKRMGLLDAEQERACTASTLTRVAECDTEGDADPLLGSHNDTGDNDGANSRDMGECVSGNGRDAAALLDQGRRSLSEREWSGAPLAVPSPRTGMVAPCSRGSSRGERRGSAQGTMVQSKGNSRGSSRGGVGVGVEHSPVKRSSSIKGMHNTAIVTQAELLDAAHRMQERMRKYGEPTMLVPVAIYKDLRYRQMAANIIMEFNKKGLIITPWLYSTLTAVNATVTIQAWLRAQRVRTAQNFDQLVKHSRAAIFIQRCFRGYLMRCRLQMLSAIRKAVRQVNSLLLGASLALTATACAHLRDKIGRHRALFPEQRLRWGFNRAGNLIGIEPRLKVAEVAKGARTEKAVQRHAALLAQRAREPVRSLPLWCSVSLELQSELSAVTAHSMREVLTQKDMLTLLSQGANWKDLAGAELSKRSLPDGEASSSGMSAAGAIAGPKEEVLAIVSFASMHEAALRTAMLLAMTWDCRRGTGCCLAPLHLVNGGPALGAAGVLSGSAGTSGAASRLGTPAARAGTPAEHRLPLPSSPVPTPGSWRHSSPTSSRPGTVGSRPGTTPGIQPTASGLGSVLSPRASPPKSSSRMGTPVSPAQSRTPPSRMQAAGVSPSPRHLSSQQGLGTPSGRGAGIAQAGMVPLPIALRPGTTPTPMRQRMYDEGVLEPVGRYGSINSHADGSLSPGQEGSTSDLHRQPSMGGSPTPWDGSPRGTAARALSHSLTLTALPGTPEPLGRTLSRVQMSPGAGDSAVGGANMHRSMSRSSVLASSSQRSIKRAATATIITATSIAAGAGVAGAAFAQYTQQLPSSLLAQEGADGAPMSQAAGSSSLAQEEAFSSRQNFLYDPSSPTLEHREASVLQTQGPPSPVGTASGMQDVPQQYGSLSVDVQAAELDPDAEEREEGWRLFGSVAKQFQKLGNADWLLLPLQEGTEKTRRGQTLPAQDMDSGTRLGQNPKETLRMGPAGDLIYPPGVCGDTNANPDLQVARMRVDPVLVHRELQAIAADVGSVGREQRTLADRFKRELPVVLAEARRQRHGELMDTLMLTQVVGRQAATGHTLAPGYMPLSVGAMGDWLAEMRAVYQSAAAELVQTMRQTHTAAMAEVKTEQLTTAAATAARAAIQSGVVESALTAYKHAVEKASSSRVTHRCIRNMRKQRMERDRSFAAAFGRQANGLGKQIVRSELRTRAQMQAGDMAMHGEYQRAVNEQTQANAHLGKADVLAINQWKAQTVRASGYTDAVAEHYTLLSTFNHDLVALRRDENYSRMRRVGPAGGVWGSAKPKESLRQPLPLGSVVSAAEARAKAQALAGALAGSQGQLLNGDEFTQGSIPGGYGHLVHGDDGAMSSIPLSSSYGQGFLEDGAVRASARTLLPPLQQLSGHGLDPAMHGQEFAGAVQSAFLPAALGLEEPGHVGDTTLQPSGHAPLGLPPTGHSSSMRFSTSNTPCSHAPNRHSSPCHVRTPPIGADGLLMDHLPEAPYARFMTRERPSATGSDSSSVYGRPIGVVP